MISGGRPLDHLDRDGIAFVQLPHVIVKALEFSILRSPDGALVSDAYMDDRRSVLVEALQQFNPDALITELFPFGRRVLAPEFLTAIKTVRGMGTGRKILCSVRDVPEPKPKRIDETAERLTGHFDGVVVHGDADFLPLTVTWPLPPKAATLLHHTGYMGRSVLPAPDAREGTVLVAAGGGVLGRFLLESAAQASRLGTLQWHILCGGADGAEVAAKLTERFGHPRVRLEAARPDYLDLVQRAGCAVTLAGYNTAVELAGLTIPVILVPSEEADEKEQLIRAERFASFDGFDLMRERDLTAAALAERAETLATGPGRAPVPLQIDDGTRAVQKIERLLETSR
ncbi:MAG: glycosyltransferase [Pseudomonadota bacterium]